jgi:hypothetical protein
MLLNRYIYRHFISALLVSLLYLLSYSIVFGFSKAEATLNPYVQFVSIIFLPHGIRVLTTLIFRSLSAFFYLLCAGIITQFFFVGFNQETGMIIQFMPLLIGAISAPLAFSLVSFSIGKDRTYLEKPDTRSWRVLTILTLTSAAINGFGQTVVTELNGNEIPTMKIQLTFILGDTIGTLIVLLSAYLVIRFRSMKN